MAKGRTEGKRWGTKGKIGKGAVKINKIRQGEREKSKRKEQEKSNKNVDGSEEQVDKEKISKRSKKEEQIRDKTSATKEGKAIEKRRKKVTKMLTDGESWWIRRKR